MRDNWNIFEEKTPKEKEAKVFSEYHNQMRIFLQNVKTWLFRTFVKKYKNFSGTDLINYLKVERTWSIADFRYYTEFGRCRTL